MTIDKHTCPKCRTELIKVNGTYSLVGYVSHGDRDKTKSDINPQSALPLEVYYCESCRRVELVAG